MTMDCMDGIKWVNDTFISERKLAHQYNAPELINELKHLSKIYRVLQARCDNARAEAEDSMRESYMASKSNA